MIILFKEKRFFKTFCLAVFCLFMIIPAQYGHTLVSGIDRKISKKLEKLVKNGGYIVTKDNRIILSFNPDKELIPASTWKVVTALAALDTLGDKYRFKTEFFSDSHKNLYIKGFGDPFLVSEEVDQIIEELKDHGMSEINNIYLDNSSFRLNKAPSGVSSSLNPYDVLNSALAVNFNTIYFSVAGNGSVRSAEKQTPTLPIMEALGRGFKRGTYRINISRKAYNILRYTGELFREFQGMHKIPGRGTETARKVPDNLKPFYTHYSSKTLADIIKEMMYYSNNYIANQIYLTMGAHEYGYPATWKKAQNYLRKYIDRNFPEYSKSMTFDEGSGISRNNRISPRAMIRVLEKFKPHARLLRLEKGVLIKSGTLKDVHSYAGYFTRKGRRDSFVIILNQKENNRDRMLMLMKRAYEDSP